MSSKLWEVHLRLIQGLALGGEYGGAATYVAENALPGQRGRATSWIQTTATLGFFLSLVVILLCRLSMSEEDFRSWGWRVPFLVSIVLLVFSIYIRLKLDESPLFKEMKANGKASRAPIRDSFFRLSNAKFVFLALFGAVAGQAVVWYTGQFYALYFLTTTLKVNFLDAYVMIAIALLLATPFFIVFGRLSDKVGRKWIMLCGCIIAAATYIPLFQGLTHFANPALESAQKNTQVVITARDCNIVIIPSPSYKPSACDQAKSYLAKSGVSYRSENLSGDQADEVLLQINNQTLKGFNESEYQSAIAAAGYPGKADPAQMNKPMIVAILFVMVLYVTMVYGSIAAFLVELFPTNIRYTSMSLPYHIGNGWFGGFLPLVAATGDIYFGLWYPIIIATMTFVIGAFFLPETKDRDFNYYSHDN